MALNNRTNRRDSVAFVFVTRVFVYIVFHLVVFGTETISSDKRSMDISDTLKLRVRERSGLVVECLTRYRRAAGSPASLRCVLEQDTLILA